MIVSCACMRARGHAAMPHCQLLGELPDRQPALGFRRRKYLADSGMQWLHLAPPCPPAGEPAGRVTLYRYMCGQDLLHVCLIYPSGSIPRGSSSRQHSADAASQNGCCQCCVSLTKRVPACSMLGQLQSVGLWVGQPPAGCQTSHAILHCIPQLSI
jgi:hypothetical protein